MARTARYFREISTFTLNWKPETKLDLVATEGDVGSHALVGADGVVRAIREGET